jgi:hypothetical protein
MIVASMECAAHIIGFLGASSLPSPAISEDKACPRDANSSSLHRKIGTERWVFELKDFARQKWYHQQRNAIFKAMLRLSKTCGAHSAIVIIPDTLNAATYSTAGTYSEFIRAWSAVLAGIRRRKEATIHASITEIWAKYQQDNKSNETKPFDLFFSGCIGLVHSTLLNSARKALDDEIAFTSPGPVAFGPENSRLSECLSKALSEYAAMPARP